MNVGKSLFLLSGLLGCLGFFGCGKDRDIPDVSGIQADVKLRRFEQGLFALDTNSIEPGLAALEGSFPEFAPVFFGQVLGSKDSTVAPEGHERYVRGFVAHPAVRKLYDTCIVVYPDVKKLEKDFGQAFQFYKYYFPTQPLSGEVVTYISEYSIGGFLYGDNSIGVGLDFYLGEGYPYQQYNPENPNFSKYLVRTFNQDHIVAKSMRLLVQDLLGPPPGNRMLDHMVHNGKELYILDHLLPRTPDSIKLEYTGPQTAWCDENEANMGLFPFGKARVLYRFWHLSQIRGTKPQLARHAQRSARTHGQLARLADRESLYGQEPQHQLRGTHQLTGCAGHHGQIEGQASPVNPPGQDKTSLGNSAYLCPSKNPFVQ